MRTVATLQHMVWDFLVENLTFSLIVLYVLVGTAYINIAEFMHRMKKGKDNA